MKVGDKVFFRNVSELRSAIGSDKAAFEPTGDDLLVVTWISGNNHWINVKDWVNNFGAPVMLPKKFFESVPDETVADTAPHEDKQTVAQAVNNEFSDSVVSGMTDGVSDLVGDFVNSAALNDKHEFTDIPANEAATQNDHAAVDRDDAARQDALDESEANSEMSDAADEASNEDIEAAIRNVFSKMGYEVSDLKFNEDGSASGHAERNESVEVNEDAFDLDALKAAVEASRDDFLAAVAAKQKDAGKEAVAKKLMSELASIIEIAGAQTQFPSTEKTYVAGSIDAYRTILHDHFGYDMRMVPQFFPAV